MKLEKGLVYIYKTLRQATMIFVLTGVINHSTLCIDTLQPRRQHVKVKNQNYLTISEFSKIAEVSRKALIFYDNIGLFSPVYTGENGYRYYSHEQIYIITVINILKELGTPLNQIKAYMKMPSPLEAIHLLDHQEQILSKKIEELCQVQNMLHSKKQKLEVGMCTDISEITVVQREETPLFISDPFVCSKADLSDELWLAFYMKCKENKIALGYPEGFLVEKNYVLTGNTMVANRIICHVGDKAYANSFMPRGTYLTAWGQGGFENTEPIYRRLLQHIEEHGLTISGNAYEERLIDEIGSFNKKQQIIQVSINISF